MLDTTSSTCRTCRVETWRDAPSGIWAIYTSVHSSVTCHMPANHSSLAAVDCRQTIHYLNLKPTSAGKFFVESFFSSVDADTRINFMQKFFGKQWQTILIAKKNFLLCLQLLRGWKNDPHHLSSRTSFCVLWMKLTTIQLMKRTQDYVRDYVMRGAKCYCHLNLSDVHATGPWWRFHYSSKLTTFGSRNIDSKLLTIEWLTNVFS